MEQEPLRVVRRRCITYQLLSECVAHAGGSKAEQTWPSLGGQTSQVLATVAGSQMEGVLGASPAGLGLKGGRPCCRWQPGLLGDPREKVPWSVARECDYGV